MIMGKDGLSKGQGFMKLRILFALIIVLIITGCANNTEEKKPKNREYTLKELTLSETTEEYTKDIKYPQLSNEDDYFKDINKLILDSINEFDVFDYDRELYDGMEFIFTGDYEIKEQSKNGISIVFVISSYIAGYPGPSEFCYGLNIDLATEKVVKLNEKVESMDAIIDAVNDEKYVAEYGAFTQMSKEEILDDIEDVFNEKEFNTYKYNFYMTEDKVYLIVDDVIASDYGIILLQ